MSKMKKMFAMIAAATMLCGSFSAMSVSATYDTCDVNQDGTVNMVDSLAISQHLSGVIYYSDYHLLDVNRSHTVDATDLNYITKKLLTGTTPSTCYIRQYSNAQMEVVNMPPVSSTLTLDNSINETNIRWYIGYSYLDNAPISRYSLTATMATVSTANAAAYGLINGVDDRGVAHGYENTGIVWIKSGTSNSTGFIVGDHHIATAAHCVYDYKTENFLPNLEINTYDRTGAPVANGELSVAEVHVPENYAIECSEFDYALITVEEDLSDYVHFDIGNSYNMTMEAATIPLHVTGRPGYANGNSNSNDNLLYTHYGRVHGATSTTFLMHLVDISEGQSGAPVYTITRERYNGVDSYTYTALAVNTGSMPYDTYNTGTLMTKYHQQFYNNNPYADY